MRCRYLFDRLRVRTHRALLLTVAGVLRLIWVISIRPEYYSDFALYLDLAQSMADGNGYRMGGALTAFMPPGYPFWLTALIVAHIEPVVGQVALSVLSVLLLYMVVRELSGNERAALAAGYLLALYPNHIAYSSLLASELLQMCCVFAGCVWLIKALRYSHASLMVLAGMAFSYGTLVKAQAVLTPVLILIAWLVHERRRIDLAMAARLCVAFACAWLAVQTPWFVRNMRLFGQPVWVSTNHGYNMLIGFNPMSDGGYGLEALPKQEVVNEVEFDRRLYRAAVRNLRNEPLRYLGLLPVKLLRLYAGDGDGILYNYMHTNRPIMEACDNHLLCAYQQMTRHRAHGHRWLALFWVNLAYYAGVIGLFAVSIIKRRIIFGHGRAAVLLTSAILIVAYYSAVSSVSFGGLRFHFVIIPWMMACAACYATVRRSALPPRQSRPSAVQPCLPGDTGDTG